MQGKRADVSQVLRKKILPVLLVIVALTSGPTPAIEADTNAPPSSTPVDVTAQKFLQSCAGCHTIGGGKLNGPDLITASKWSNQELKPAIKRMEQRVGPLTDPEIDAIAEFIRDEKANERLKAAEAVISQKLAAKLEPASASVGRELYFGRKALGNGGMACSSCHAVKGNGGLLGPDLTGVYGKMGETPLVSAIEKSGFKVMAAAYRTHPVTKQESMHLARYLSQVANEPQVVRAPVWPLGAAGAGVFFIGLMAWKRSAGNGRRPKLQRRRK